MKGFYKFLFYPLLSILCLTASGSKDSLDIEFKNYLSERINLNDLENNPIQSYLKSDSLVRSFSLEKDTLFNARFYHLLGKINADKGNDRIAIQYFNTTESYFDSYNPDIFFVELFLDRGNIYNKTNNLEATKADYNKALLLSQQLENKISTSTCHNNLGLLCIQEGKLEEAKVHFDNSYELRKQIGDKFLIGHSFRHTGIYNFHNKEYKKAISKFKESIEIYSSLNNVNSDLLSQELCHGYNDMGFAYYKIKQFKKAKECALKAIDIIAVTKDDRVKLKIEFQSAKVLFYANYLNESIEITQNIAKEAQENGKMNLELKCYKLLTDCYEAQGQFDQGIKYARQSQAIKEKIHKIQLDKQLANERFSYQAMSNKKLMSMIEKENTLKTTELEAQENVTQLLFLLILISLLGIVALFYSNHQKVKINDKLTTKNKLIENQNLEIRKQQNALKTAKSELEDKVAEMEVLTDEKSHLMSIVAHDLRTPLNSILGLVELLKMEDTAEAKEQYLTLIVDSGNRMLGMINTLLNVKKIEAQKIEVNFENVNINKVLRRILNDFKTWSNNKSIKIEIKDIDVIQSVYADENLLNQVLENLLSNAIKYSPIGGEIQIIGSAYLNTYSISFIDNGPGISEADQKKMFNKYQRLTAQPTAGEDSMGIGLSLVKKLVNLMNCEISVKSKLGSGSTFTVKFNTTKQV
ncbi:MAG: ATP-binding protein [Salibacteraceae bacterium]